MAAEKYNPNRSLEDMSECYAYSRFSSELHESAEEISLRGSRAEVVKSPSAARSKSIYRDAAFVREVQSLDSKACVITGGLSSVCYPLAPHSPPLTPLDSLTASIKARAPRRSKADPWWVSRSASPVRRFRGPADWRDTTDQLRALYAHRALRRLGSTFAVSLRLRDDIEALARGKASPLRWLQERVRIELTRVLGHSPEFYLTLEEDEGRRLHLHGEVALSSKASRRQMLRKLVAVRKALRRAGGEWPATMPRQHQCKLVADPDEFWSSYTCKDFWKLTPLMRQMLASNRGSVMRPAGFKGPALSLTSTLRKEAETLYTRDVARMVGM